MDTIENTDKSIDLRKKGRRFVSLNVSKVAVRISSGEIQRQSECSERWEKERPMALKDLFSLFVS